ncbi:Nitrile-specifier protein 5 [Fulvia fulva]|uniref:Nitrile-specifier protein 5 n=1 Tax=Passalora fulva TaxID=5499 RepID=A0A9Q8PGD7_PASFU|nr:Nitrile-specifier protein 5 [Fulvia fulva]KAK4614252.1 Nitrile-specifier protein 5 [Fulvia fulva]KAK4615112.1 Nitrile-specifier protein 5 [Fulvia fulva]UJO22011.1 Nitrile-specifier protein 5 [Fulvia fulva]WPV20121.1 Nitrile-specifier protein 5 [Fulvia fulva]WPV35589.1 Nitrile-specifier protein 5 [Fulvia fulva]
MATQATLTAKWTKMTNGPQLQRSSHTVTTVDKTLYIFGGELKPREPRDNDLHKYIIGSGTDVTTLSADSQGTAPSARVGSTTAALNGKMYLFSGRGGPEMAPVDEEGGLWILDAGAEKWDLVKPASSTFPEARSFHCTTNDGKETLYIHAGCPEKGRLADLWSFNVSTKEWRQLASAPDPPRGGTSIAFAEGKLYRMNGFDGQHEVGGALDIYDPASDSWSSTDFNPDGKDGPGARSVAALIPVKRHDGVYLVTLFGESDPSALGHQGAGKMLSDVWAYSLREGKWLQVVAEGNKPEGRGWFDADVVSLDGAFPQEKIAVVGGLGESNERLDDLWLLTFGANA